MNLYKMLCHRKQNPVTVGVIGAGKFASMFLGQAWRTPGMRIVGVAELDPQKAYDTCIELGWPAEQLIFADTATAVAQAAAAGKTAITGDAAELIAADFEVLVEVTGNPVAGADHAVAGINSGKHLVMPNVETDCLVGPLLSKTARDKGLCFSMAYGDQPALILEMIDWAQTTGFHVVCAGKGTRYQPRFRYSTPETVWNYYGFSEEMVKTGGYNPKMFNSFLDGTKSAIEMCAVANAAGLSPAPGGLSFPPVGVDHLQEVLKPESEGGVLPFAGTVECVASEDRFGVPVHNDLRWGVYVVLGAPTPYVKRCFAEYGMKTDASGNYTALYRPYHFIGLELGVSVASVALRKETTGESRFFAADVAATAKRDLKPGDILDGEGGYTVFGTLLSAQTSLARRALPLGLAGGAVIKRPVPEGALLVYNDVELNESTTVYRLRKDMEAAAESGTF